MPLAMKRYSALVVADSSTFQTIRGILRGYCDSVSQVTTMTAARQRIAQSDVDLLIVNTPAQDEFGTDGVLDLVERRQIQAMLIVKTEQYEQVFYRTRGSGIFVVTRPLKGLILLEGVGLLINMREKLTGMLEENRRLKKRLEEMSLITRAKCLLIEKQQMSEAEAHRYLETEAMNSSLTRKEIAQSVILRWEET